MPFLILSRPTIIRCFLVASFLADVIQHIHSFLARGVISTHKSFTIGSDSIALLKSAGVLCTVPSGITFFDIQQLYQNQLRIVCINLTKRKVCDITVSDSHTVPNTINSQF